MTTHPSIQNARAVLAANDRGGYTVPTDRLYPFQWNWDSAFVAMGFATYDLDRAILELERLIEGQWHDGMIPHIVFHRPSDTYFPGPEIWRTTHRIPTSGITQPPVFALAVRMIAERAAGAYAGRLTALYRAALAFHRWWAAARDPQGTGLVAVLHNWETGRDNSPEWDEAFRRVPQTTTTPIMRRDVSHVDAAMRPRDEDYRRYIHLVDLYASLGWRPEAMWAQTPFLIADVGMNAILCAAEDALGDLALRFGTDAERSEISARHRRMQHALVGMWSEEHQHFLSRDLKTGAPIPVRTSAGFLPLLAELPDSAPRRALARRLEAVERAGLMPVPSTLRGETGYEPKRYWRGPVWAVVNWAIARGFARSGLPDHAKLIEARTRQAIEAAGFCEYFDPETGEGLGGNSFSWTAAILLLIDEGWPVL